MQNILLKNTKGQVIRTIHWNGEAGYFVQRHDLRRLEFCGDLKELVDKDIPYSKVAFLQRKDLSSPIHIKGIGTVELASHEARENILLDFPTPQDSKKVWWLALGSVTASSFILVTLLLMAPTENIALEEELRTHVVKVVRRAPPKKQSVVAVKRQISMTSNDTSQVKLEKKITAVKRLGVLGVLGSLNKSKQKGGLNLSAAKTTAGPGLGGAQGSGGMQTTLYGKGLIAAPIGIGGKLEGAGGYGTKGKGGGQDGLGKLDLIGSGGTNPIPLGHEALIEGGLDRDLIAQVIQKNLGQVRFCYEQGLQGDPSLAGRVAVDFTIGGEGVVKTARIGSTNLQSDLVEACILRRLRSWKFPAPDGGVNVRVSYPFVLRRAGNG
jgi:hypothetical protein